MIHGDRWSEAVEQGWRFFENFREDDTEFNAMRVAAAVQQHGIGNVKVGTAFGTTAPARFTECSGFAIYVRDGQEILDELREDMLNYEHGHEMDEMVA